MFRNETYDLLLGHFHNHRRIYFHLKNESRPSRDLYASIDKKIIPFYTPPEAIHLSQLYFYSANDSWVIPVYRLKLDTLYKRTQKLFNDA